MQDQLGRAGLHQAAGYPPADSMRAVQVRVSTRLNDRLCECNASLRSSIQRIEQGLNQLSYEGNQPMPPSGDKPDVPADSTLDAQQMFMAQLEEHVSRLQHLAQRLELI